ncbi:MAG: radical SAM protein [Methanobacteriota archaeon]|nr:MAG: radical SAM protein [Euryarchaeota archaeon]
MPKGSARRGAMPDGCKLCEKGAKLVLLVTGRCGRRCYYCPLSKTKRGRDVFYANEARIERADEAVREARLMDALGTGVTGGDPLLALRRTNDAIRALKRAFGDGHHIHLYTSTTDSRRIRAAARAGLDEIRFHPPVGMWKRLHRSEYAQATRAAVSEGIAVGLEVPAIPGREQDALALMDFAESAGLDFVNLNELEFSETNCDALRSRGMSVKDDVSSGVRGSERLAMAMFGGHNTVPLHYCSAAFKDGIQLRRRIARRGRNVRRPHEIITDEGLLLKGVIDTDDADGVTRVLIEDYHVPRRLVWHDEEKGRLEVAAWVLADIADRLGEESYVVEEYPTADRLEVERTPLRRR